MKIHSRPSLGHPFVSSLVPVVRWACALSVLAVWTVTLPAPATASPALVTPLEPLGHPVAVATTARLDEPAEPVEPLADPGAAPRRTAPSEAGLSGTPFEILTRTVADGELGPVASVAVLSGGEVVYRETFRPGATVEEHTDALLGLGATRAAQGDPVGHGEGGNDVWEHETFALGSGDAGDDGTVDAAWLDDEKGGRVMVVGELDLVAVVVMAPGGQAELSDTARAVLEDHVLMSVEMGEGR